MDELHQQTVNLLSFQQLPKAVFDAQVAFNILARYGEQSSPALSSISDRVQRHYRKIAGASAAELSLLLLQAPIFHGHALTLFLETDSRIDSNALSEALAGDHVSVPGPEEDAPSNVSSAGQANILASVKSDPSQPNGIWLWAAADNLRIAALTAVECAESMTATRPSGKIQ